MQLYILFSMNNIRAGRNVQNALPYLKQLAETGYHPAQYLFAVVLLANDEDQHGHSLAASYLKIVADVGYIDARYRYSILLWNGDGVEQDIESSIRYLRMAAESGHIEALGNASVIFFHRHDYSAADRYFQRFITEANSGTLRTFEFRCYSGDGIPVDFWFGTLSLVIRVQKQIAAMGRHVGALSRLEEIRFGDPRFVIDYMLAQAATEEPDSGYVIGRILFSEKRVRPGICAFLKAIRKGHSLTEQLLFEMIVGGTLSRDDAVYLASRLKKTADRDCGPCQALYGLCSTFGRGVTVNPIRAAEYYQKAAERDLPFAIFMCGRIYTWGHGVPMNRPIAINYFRRIKDGNPEALHQFVWLLLLQTKLESKLEARWRDELRGSMDSQILSADVIETIEAVERIASGGDSHGMCLYGFCRELGFGTERDPNLALQLYCKAAEFGNAAALYRYSLCLRDGLAIRRDIELSILYLEKAAIGGHGDAQHDYAMCLHFGIFRAINRTDACKYLAKAAIAGNVNAQMAVMANPDDFDSDLSDGFADWKSKIGGRCPCPLESLDERRSMYDRFADRRNDMIVALDGDPTGWTRFIRSSV
jgi:TPR repeat protein